MVSPLLLSHREPSPASPWLAGPRPHSASNALPEEDAEEVGEAGVTEVGSHEAFPTKTPMPLNLTPSTPLAHLDSTEATSPRSALSRVRRFEK